jgi:phage host-nuclease inhibitor protein Gam
MAKSSKRPHNVLPKNAVVKSVEDVERALAELQWLDREARKIRDQYDEMLLALFAERDAKMTLSDGVRFDERTIQLIAAVETFATEHRDELLEGIEGKTRGFESGAITFRNIADKLVPRSEDKTLDVVLDEFLKKHKVKTAIDELLNGELAPDVRVGDLVTIRYSWNQAYAKAAIEKKTLNAKALPLKLEPQPERITVELKADKA